MDAGYVVRQLRAAGTDAEIADDGIRLDGALVHLEDAGSRPPTPSDLQRMVKICTARANDGVIRPVITATRASPRAIAWVKSNPDVTLVLDDRVVLGGVEHHLAETPPSHSASRGKKPYARFAVARVLLSGASRSDQVGLAQRAGVTQGSVSNALRRLPVSQKPGDVFDDLVKSYPGPGGQAFYWWSGRPVHEQARALKEHGALLSGDFAADRIAPWRLPERVVAYVNAPIDLADAGYVLAGPSDFTALVVVAADPTLRATAAAWGADVADPIIAAYDVRRTATTGDDDEAVEKLRDVVVTRFADG